MASNLTVKILSDFSQLDAGLRAVSKAIDAIASKSKSIDFTLPNAEQSIQRVSQAMESMRLDAISLDNDLKARSASIVASLNAMKQAAPTQQAAPTSAKSSQKLIATANAINAINQALSASNGVINNFVQELQKIDAAAEGLHKIIKPLVADFKVFNTQLSEVTKRMQASASAFSRFSTTTATALNAAQNSVTAFGHAAAAAFNAIHQPATDIADAFRGIRAATNDVQRAGREADRARSLFEMLFAALGGAIIGSTVSQIFWRLGDALLRLPGTMIELVGGLEQTKIALDTMVGSGKQATAFMQELQQFAIQTPFEFEGLMSSAKLLMAMGINAKAVIPILRAVGDSLAAVGGKTEQINNVSRALAQMAAKGKLNAEELNQLAENGIPAVDMLAKKIGVTTGKIMEMAEKSQLASAKYLPILINEMERRFQGMMEKQNKTITGSLAMLSDAWKFTLGEIGLQLNRMTSFTDGIRRLADAIMRIGQIIKQYGLADLIHQVFGVTAPNFIRGVNTALIGTGAAMVGLAGYTVATASAYAGLRTTIIAASLATVKQTVLFGVIAGALYAVGVNLGYLGERFRYFGDQAVVIIENVAEKLGLITERISEVGSITLEDIVTGNWRRIQRNGIDSFWQNWNESTTRNSNRLEAIWGRQFTHNFVNPITEAQKAYANFSGLFAESSNMIDKRAQQVSTGLLGIAAGIEPAKTNADALAKKAARAADKLEIVRNAYARLGPTLEAITKREIELGFAYDENKALAEALSPVISALTAKYGVRSSQVRELIKVQTNYLKLSAAVGDYEKRNWATMQKVIEVGQRLSTAFRQISQEAEDAGGSFNAHEKRVKALRSAYKELSAIDMSKVDFKGFIGKIPKDAFAGIDLPAELAKQFKNPASKTAVLNAIQKVISSEQTKANIFDVSEITKQAASELDVNRKTAAALGEAWNESEEQVKSYAEQIKQLTRKDTPEATAKANELAQKIKKITDADVVLQFKNVNEKVNNMASFFNGVGQAIGGVIDLLGAFGIKADESFKVGIQAAMNMVNAFTAIVGGIMTAMAAFQLMTTTLKIDPIYLALTAVAAVIVGIIAVVEQLTKSEVERLDKIGKMQQDYNQKLLDTKQTMRDITQAAIDSYETRGDMIRELTDNEMRYAERLVAQFETVAFALSDVSKMTEYQIKQNEAALERIGGALQAIMPSAITTAMKTGNQAFIDSTRKWQRNSVDIVAETTAKIGNTLRGGLIDAVKSAGKAFLEGASDWEWQLRKGIKDAIMGGIMDAMIKRSVIDRIMPQIDALAARLAEGAPVSQITEAARSIFAQTNVLASNLQAALGPLKGLMGEYTTEAPKFNEAYAGVIGGANELMSQALMAGDTLGIGRAAELFRQSRAAAYQTNTVNVSYNGNWSPEDARKLGEMIVKQINRAGKA